MATKTNPQYEPDTLYEVKLARPIKVGRTVINPMQNPRLKGKVVEEHIADILEAKKVL
ncbi:hypothetical protein [Ensifer sp. LCM 4579]|uniref:hypothetical protein n=1 Tax=Ensifer sp. LCM 4579 TaxID=1848292 RepID=UPI00155EF57C|nr:hypothetical protein [Ensifer sp. LCM 4579]